MTEPIKIYSDKKFAAPFLSGLFAFSMWLVLLIAKNDAEIWLEILEFTGAAGLLFISGFGLFTVFSKRFKYVSANSQEYYDSKLAENSKKEPFIKVTETEITCDYPSQKKQDKIRWDEIDLIQVLTTDEGPAVCDVFIMLQNTQTNKGVAIPSDRLETKAIVNRIIKFPDFDGRTWVEAMGSAENKWFTVWRKKK